MFRMRGARKPAVVAVVLSAMIVLPAASAHAYCKKAARVGHSARVVQMPAVPSSWTSALAASANAWNGKANWTFYFTRATYGPQAGELTYSSLSRAGYPPIPGITWSDTGSAWTVMNSDFQWNLNGTMNKLEKKADVRTIATHELGHWVILLHPDECGQPPTSTKQNAVMYPNWRTKHSLNSDDVAGLVALQGPAPSSSLWGIDAPLGELEGELTDSPSVETTPVDDAEPSVGDDLDPVETNTVHLSTNDVAT